MKKNAFYLMLLLTGITNLVGMDLNPLWDNQYSDTDSDRSGADSDDYVTYAHYDNPLPLHSPLTLSFTGIHQTRNGSHFKFAPVNPENSFTVTYPTEIGTSTRTMTDQELLYFVGIAYKFIEEMPHQERTQHKIVIRALAQHCQTNPIITTHDFSTLFWFCDNWQIHRR